MSEETELDGSPGPQKLTTRSVLKSNSTSMGGSKVSWQAVTGERGNSRTFTAGVNLLVTIESLPGSERLPLEY